MLINLISYNINNLQTDIFLTIKDNYHIIYYDKIYKI